MSAAGRVGRAWRALEGDQRLAGIAAVLLMLSMLLPWYEVASLTESDGRSAFEVYSFVEAAIFLVAAGVLVLLFARGERKAFHLPGGDGTVIMAAGLWVMVLVFYRQLDKPDVAGGAGVTVGVAWGIFVAFLLGALLAYAGFRIRAAHVAEPPADDVPPPAPDAPPPPASASRGGGPH
jgi:hypothetical protein